MSSTSRRYAQRNSSGQSDSGPELASGAQDISPKADRDSSDDHNEETARAPLNIARELQVLRRQMELNFRNLHDDLRDTNQRLDKTNQRLEAQEERLEAQGGQLKAQGGQLGQLKAQMMNQRATHINNPIQAVGSDDGSSIPIELSQRYQYVHQFLRLKRRDNWQVLAELLRFYGSSSWPTWGLVSLSLGDESDTEEPLISHHTLEAAITWAPEIALQELARYVGLDYDKIMANVENYESLQQSRAMQNKRAMTSELSPLKREKLGIPEQHRPHLPEADRTEKPASISGQSGEIGWDTRATEDRTPESQRRRFKNAPQYQRPQPSLSPTSVATSDAELPTRTKR